MLKLMLWKNFPIVDFSPSHSDFTVLKTVDHNIRTHSLKLSNQNKYSCYICCLTGNQGNVVAMVTLVDLLLFKINWVVCQNETKGVIRNRNSKNGRQYNGQKKKDKRTNNDSQNITQKTKDRTTRAPLKQTIIKMDQWEWNVCNALISNMYIYWNCIPTKTP